METEAPEEVDIDNNCKYQLNSVVSLQTGIHTTCLTHAYV